VRKLHVLLILIFVSSCTPFVTTTPRPSPQPVRVAYTAVLRPWVEILNQCALEHPEIALITIETSNTDPKFMMADVTLQFGEPPRGIPGYAATLGQDELVIIAGPSVGLKDISTEQLKTFYTESDTLYQAWSYPEGNELRNIFDAVVLGDSPTSPFTLLAPNPEAMLEAITTNSLAIGYVPQSWLTAEVSKLSTEDDLHTALQLPILALTDAEPQEGIQPFLVCLQNTKP